jgi:hypothetical protein
MSANLYEYAFNDPVNLIDATGALPWFATALIGTGIGGIYGAVSAFASGSNPAEGLAKGALVGFGIGSGAYVGTLLAGGSVGATVVFTSAGGAGGAAYATLTAQLWLDGEANEEELCKNTLIGLTVPFAAASLTLYASGVGYGAEAGVAVEVVANISGGAADLLGDATQEQSSR